MSDRDIKFRAWHLEERKMWRDVGTDGYGGIILDTQHMGLKPLKGQAILLQYTGLKDINGKEIYEGDIVKTTYSQGYALHLVRWHPPGWNLEYMGAVNVSSWFKYDGTPYDESLMNDRLEVLGNIYEHGYLLDTCEHRFDATEDLPSPADIHGIMPNLTGGKPIVQWIKERWGDLPDRREE